MTERFQSSVEVHAPANVCYRKFHNFESFPQFMQNVQQVRRKEENRWHWVVNGPLGHDVEWDAVVDSDEPNRQISWHTVSKPEVRAEGTLRFDEVDADHTRITSTIQYEPRGGPVGEAIGKIFSNPHKMVDEDLHRFKNMVEGLNVPAQHVEPDEIGPHTNAADSNTLGQTANDNPGIDADRTGIYGNASGVATGNVGRYNHTYTEQGEVIGPLGLEDSVQELNVSSSSEVGDVDMPVLEDIYYEEDPYLGTGGAYQSEGLIEMRADEPLERDVFTESMDVYDQDLESFTEDLDEDIDSALTPRGSVNDDMPVSDKGLVNQERPTEHGEY